MIGQTCDSHCLRPLACVRIPEGWLQPLLEATIEGSPLKIISFGHPSKCLVLIFRQDRLNYLGRSCNLLRSRLSIYSHFATYTYLCRFFHLERSGQHRSLLLLITICPCHAYSLNKNLLSNNLQMPRCIFHFHGIYLSRTHHDTNLQRGSIQYQNRLWSFMKKCLSIRFVLRQEDNHSHVVCRSSILLRNLI